MAELGLDVGTDALMTSLSGGQAARAARPRCSSPLRPRAARRAHQRPRPRGPQRLEGSCAGCARGSSWSPRSRVLLPGRDSRRRLHPAQRQVAVYDGGYNAFLEERATARGHAREAYEEYAGRRWTWSAAPEPSGSGAPKGSERHQERPGQRQDPPQGERGVLGGQAQKVRQMESWIAPPGGGRGAGKKWALRFAIGSARAHSVVATLDAATASLGRFTFGPASLQVNAGDRIGVTVPRRRQDDALRLLLGRLAPETGRASLGASVAVGRIDRPVPDCPRNFLSGTLPDDDAADGSCRRPDTAGEVGLKTPRSSASSVALTGQAHACGHGAAAGPG